MLRLYLEQFIEKEFQETLTIPKENLLKIKICSRTLSNIKIIIMHHYYIVKLTIKKL